MTLQLLPCPCVATIGGRRLRLRLRLGRTQNSGEGVTGRDRPFPEYVLDPAPGDGWGRGSRTRIT